MSQQLIGTDARGSDGCCHRSGFDYYGRFDQPHRAGLGRRL
jgi:hypothetical protein